MLKAMKFTVGFAFALAFVGCSSSSGPAGPSAVVLPASPLTSVTGLSINVGSTGGGTWIKIIGTDLQRDASVTFGNATVFSNSYDPRDEPNTSLLITTPAHLAGVVDVIVTNPGRQGVRLSGGYEFVEPQSFDFNGNWSGVTIDGRDTFLEFVVRNNVLVSASCAGVTNTAVQLSTDVINGGFSAETPDGFRLSGKIVSGSQSTGKMSAPGCIGDAVWRASKVTPR
jgi:hypothetical protein